MLNKKYVTLLLTLALLNACALPDASNGTSAQSQTSNAQASKAIAQKGERYHGVVVKVADGDTITVKDKHGANHKIRLAFIDAPETKQNHGAHSRDALAQLLLNKNVVVHITDVDRYKREVALVDYNKQNVNYRQVLLGHAWHYTQYAKSQDAVEYQRFQAAQAAAKQQRSGLWSFERPVAPWDYRKRQRNSNTEPAE